MTALTVSERRDALRVVGGLTVAAAAVAGIVRVGWAAETRRLLRFGFAGVPAPLDTAVSIFARNARLLAAAFAPLPLAQAPWPPRRGARRGAVMRALGAAVDAVLALAVAVNVALVGAALGAYGERMALAMLPHGP